MELEVAPTDVTIGPTPASIIAVIARAAADPNVDIDKMTRLLELQERVMAKQAEREFNQAMTRLQPKMPVIAKRGKIEFKGAVQSRFAKYEDIDEAIRPLLEAEGFSLSFDSKVTDKGVEYSCKLSHICGHSEQKHIILPADSSGSKNSIQAIGSTVSYAKRYLVGMHLNIITRDQDDDGASVGLINDREVQNIYDHFLACQMDEASKRKFLDVAQVDAVEDISKSAYQGLISMLQKKRQKMEQR